MLEIIVKDEMNHNKDNEERSDLICEMVEDTEDFLYNIGL